MQESRANKVSACHAQLISDGGTIFAEWPENQQEAFFRAAGGANTDRNQMLLAVATLKMLQREHFRRAETEFHEGLLKTSLTVDGLSPRFRPDSSV